MAIYEIEVHGEAREVYVVEAEDAAAAERIFSDGDAGQPEVSEVQSAEVVSVRRRPDAA